MGRKCFWGFSARAVYDNCSKNDHPKQEDIMMIFSYSKAIAHVVENFLNRNEMIYRFDQDSGVFWFRLNSDSMPLFNTFCCFDVHNKYLLFEAFFPVKVSFISASLIKEELSDINSSLLNGRFQLDSESGMVKFRCYLDCSDRMPSGD